MIYSKSRTVCLDKSIIKSDQIETVTSKLHDPEMIENIVHIPH